MKRKTAIVLVGLAIIVATLIVGLSLYTFPQPSCTNAGPLVTQTQTYTSNGTTVTTTQVFSLPSSPALEPLLAACPSEFFLGLIAGIIVMVYGLTRRKPKNWE